MIFLFSPDNWTEDFFDIHTIDEDFSGIGLGESLKQQISVHLSFVLTPTFRQLL